MSFNHVFVITGIERPKILYLGGAGGGGHIEGEEVDEGNKRVLLDKTEKKRNIQFYYFGCCSRRRRTDASNEKGRCECARRAMTGEAIKTERKSQQKKRESSTGRETILQHTTHRKLMGTESRAGEDGGRR